MSLGCTGDSCRWLSVTVEAPSESGKMPRVTVFVEGRFAGKGYLDGATVVDCPIDLADSEWDKVDALALADYNAIPAAT